MRTTAISLIGLGLVLTCFGQISTPAQATNDATRMVAILKRPLPLTPALKEIVKLTQSGVAEPVTLAFIQTSPTAFSLDAEDVIQLRQQGVSAQITTALLQHGEELRRAAAESASQAQEVATAATPSNQVPPTVDSTPVPAPVVYAVASVAPTSTVSVTYFGAPTYSFAPGYYGYGFGCYPGSYSYGPRYYGCGATRVAWGVGFGGVRHGGFARCR